MAFGMGATAMILHGVEVNEQADTAALYRAQAPFVWRILRRFGVGESELEDCVHEVFLVVHRRRSDLRGAEFERSWLYGIARRVAQGAGRKQRRRPRELEVEPPSSAATPEESAALGERAELARRCLEAVHPDRRMVLVLSEMEQWTGPEIAAALELELNTVYSRLRKAKREFNAAVGRAGEEGARR